MDKELTVEFMESNGSGYQSGGQVSGEMLGTGFDVLARRPYIYNGKAYISRIVNGKHVAVPTTNAILRYDEWKVFDDAIMKAFTKRLRGIQDLRAAGCVKSLNGYASPVFAYEDMSQAGTAHVTMDGVVKGADDTPEFDTHYLPLPLTIGDFSINDRFLQESRNKGQGVDTLMAEEVAMRIAEKHETVLFTGASAYTYGGGTIRGYLDFPSRNTGTLGTNWDASAATATGIVDQVRAMKQASINDYNYGPWILYIPTAYETVMDDDFSTSYPGVTIRDRILKISGIQDVRVADYLTANNLLLIQMQPTTIRLIVGMEPRMIQWSTHGGLRHHFKIMTIMVPQPRADQNGRCGIVHYS